MLIKLKVKADAKKDTIKASTTDHFEISVKTAAKNNLANKRAIELLAEYLGVPENKIRIIKGHTTPSKIVDVINMV